MKFLNFLIIFYLAANASVFGQTSTPIAAGQSKFLGCAYSSNQAANFGKYWNQLSPENGGKWGSVEATRNVMNWTDLDASFNAAKNYHIPFKEHNLLWGAQQPSWIGGLDSASQRKEIEEWFAALAARYDSFAYIDVVNEPMNNAPNGMIPWGSTVPNVNYAKALGGAGKTGWDWVITAFKLARKYFPKSKLLINEYNVINSYSATQNYIKIINLLKADTLIDGIGEQAHAFTTYGVASSTLKSNLDLLASTGIPIYLTEMDIDGPSDLTQLQEYQRVFPIFWQHPGVKGITLWGFRTGLWRNTQGAFLITATGVERPAMRWLKAYVNDTLTLTQSILVTAPNNTDSIVVGDKIKLSAQVLPVNTTISNITWSVIQSTLAVIDASGNLTAKSDGKVTVVATAWDASGISGSFDIVISNRLADSLKVGSTGNKDTLYVGETLQMIANILPTNTTNTACSWTVTPLSRAYIGAYGLLKAMAQGEVTVKATEKDGSGVYDTMNITILNQLAQSLIISSAANEDSIQPGGKLQLNAKVLPSNTTNKLISWSVTPDSLASINANGLLTATALGKITVKAATNDGSGVLDTIELNIVEKFPNSISKIGFQNIKIYPNPAVNGNFTIQGIEHIKQIDLINLVGVRLAEYSNFNEPSRDIRVMVPKGIYILSLSDGEKSYYKKIIIQ